MSKKIALIEAGGTGLEVTNIFKKVVNHCSNQEVEFISFLEKYGYSPNTFLSLRKKYFDKDRKELNKLISKETKDLTSFYDLAQKTSVGMFRSAVNAETLYYVRKNVKKLKAVILPIKTKDIDKRIIFIRDQLQGYYVNDKLKDSKNKIEVSLQFNRQNFLDITNFTKKFLQEQRINDFELFYIYKYHLFGLELERMISSVVEETKIKSTENFSVFQPDTGMHKLLGEIAKIKKRDIVVIVGNEIGDVLLEALIHYYHLGTKETVFTLNVAFIDHEKPLEVLQTMHGSADDIVGKGLLNPLATVKAAAYVLETWLKIPNAIERMSKAIKKAIKDKIITPDMGGNKTTNEVVDYILRCFK